MSEALLKANYERDEHKWNAEKLTLNAKVQEIEQSLRTKEDEMKRQKKHLEKKHKDDI